MGQEDRRGSVCRISLGRDHVGQRQITRERHQAGQFFSRPQAGVQRHRATLRKTGEHDVGVRNSAVVFTLDQREYCLFRFADSAVVLHAHEVGYQNVVPRSHRHPAVDRDGLDRGVWEHEPNRPSGRQAQLWHDGGEVITVRTQPMQPDYSVCRVGACFDFNAFKQRYVGHGCSSGSCSCRSAWNSAR